MIAVGGEDKRRKLNNAGGHELARARSARSSPSWTLFEDERTHSEREWTGEPDPKPAFAGTTRGEKAPAVAKG